MAEQGQTTPDRPARPEAARVVEQVAITALPACLVAATVALRDFFAPGGVAAWAMLVAASLALVASGLALMWSRDNVSWRNRGGLRVWALAGLVVVSIGTLRLGRTPPSPVEYQAEIREVCNEQGAHSRDLKQRMDLIIDKEKKAASEIARKAASGEVVSFSGLALVLEEFVEAGFDAQRQERDLLGRVKDLQPPKADEDAHADLVAVWGRLIDVEDHVLLAFRQELAAADADPGKLLAAAQRFAQLKPDYADEQKRNELLRKLARSGCLPTV
jgi:hypothetical protein